MTWLIVLIACTYCFTITFTARYKEEAVEMREKNIEDKEAFDLEILVMLEENHKLKEKINRLQRRA